MIGLRKKQTKTKMENSTNVGLITKRNSSLDQIKSIPVKLIKMPSHSLLYVNETIGPLNKVIAFMNEYGRETLTVSLVPSV